ncbi:peptidoglycan DD-metalloendopeptidase family protein [Patescibacteria group bacterium]
MLILPEKLLKDIKEFFLELSKFLARHLHLSFIHFEIGKGKFVSTLYRKRGKHSRTFVHSGMAGLTAVGIMIAPVIANEFPGTEVNPWEVKSAETVLSVSDQNTVTEVSDKVRGETISYSVQNGDTLSSIAEKFGVSLETLLWRNELTEKSKIKESDILEILPVTGISHKVAKGDTVYSIAKKYDTSAQAVVDFPYNTFTNDETFELAIGQTVIVPDGVKPAERGYTPRKRYIIPSAGAVVASGNFVWPTSGGISQNFAWYHKGVDIANKGAPDILAADAGTVVVAGWPDGYGYGNRVMIDHGNGYRTLYAHLSSVFVQPGQTVNRGSVIGRMGSTGRSTGTHLHFEVISNGAYLNPLTVLQ